MINQNDWILGLYKFRKQAELETHLGDVVTNVLKEITEIREAHYKNDMPNMIEEFTDVVVYCENALVQLGEPRGNLDFIINDISIDKVLVDITVDIARFDRDKSPHIFRHISRKILLLIDALGYDADKCMMETVKKILSRKGKLNKDTGKWERNRTQDQWELYEPKYQYCLKESV